MAWSSWRAWRKGVGSEHFSTFETGRQKRAS